MDGGGGPAITQMGDIGEVLPNRYRGVAVLLPKVTEGGYSLECV